MCLRTSCRALRQGRRNMQVIVVKTAHGVGAENSQDAFDDWRRQLGTPTLGRRLRAFEDTVVVRVRYLGASTDKLLGLHLPVEARELEHSPGHVEGCGADILVPQRQYTIAARDIRKDLFLGEYPAPRQPFLWSQTFDILQTEPLGFSNGRDQQLFQ